MKEFKTIDIIQWLNDNQNKEVFISIMNHELVIEKNMKKGYTLKKQDKTYAFSLINNTDDEDIINFLLFGNSKINGIFTTNKEETEMKADCEISIDSHFTMLFYFNNENEE